MRVPRFILASMALWTGAFAATIAVLLLRLCGAISFGEPLVLFMCAYGFLSLLVMSFKVLKAWEDAQNSAPAIADSSPMQGGVDDGT